MMYEKSRCSIYFEGKSGIQEKSLTATIKKGGTHN